MRRYTALGDSVTVGVGHTVRLAPRPGHRKGERSYRGFAAVLAEALPDTELHNLARPGALVADLEREQLPAALRLHPDLASVFIGGNDTLRPNFDIDRIAASAERVIRELRESGAVVLTMRLPNPGHRLRLPGLLDRPLARRAGQINEVMDQLAEKFGTLHLDVTKDAMLYGGQMFSDPLHPNERGHRYIARRLHAMLEETGYPVGPPPGAEPESAPPTRTEQIAWLATAGVAWMLHRSVDVVPDLVGASYEQWLARRTAELQAAYPELRLEPGAADRHRVLDLTWLVLRQELTNRSTDVLSAGGSAYRLAAAAGRENWSRIPARQLAAAARRVPDWADSMIAGLPCLIAPRAHTPAAGSHGSKPAPRRSSRRAGPEEIPSARIGRPRMGRT